MGAGTGGEGAKHWLSVLAELQTRGVEDALILCCDGLKGLPDADAALKVLYLVIQDHLPNRKNVDGKTVGWKSVINTLTMYYNDRININN